MTESVDRLRDRNPSAQEQALRDAVAARADAELADALGRETGWRRVALVAALGDLRAPGPADAVLREAAGSTGPGARDLRCASLVALAKRLGAGATPDLRVAVGTRDRDVCDYAVICLAAVGDPTAWPEVLAWLGRRRSSFTDAEPATAAAAHYLLRHVRTREPRDREALAATFRRAWPVLEEDGVTSWLTSIWPGINPSDADGPTPLPEPVDPDEWRRKPLFSNNAL